VPIAEAEEQLRLRLVPASRESRIAFATEPPGASVGLRGPGDTDFVPLPAVTPCTTGVLTPATYEVRVELADVGVATRTVRAGPGETALLSLDLAAERDVGTIAVRSEPDGATIRIRPLSETSYRNTGQRTPATIGPLAVGAWRVRLDRSGYQRADRLYHETELVLEATCTACGAE